MKNLSLNKTVTSKDSGNIDRYFRDIQEYSPVSSNEETQLAMRVQQGDSRALELLVMHNTRFVISIAKKYQGRGTPLSDLISEGNIGLIEAAKRFDPSRGLRFTTYAVWWIKKSILESVDGEIKNTHTSIDAPIGGEDEDFTIANRLKSDGRDTDHIVEDESKKIEVNRMLSQLKTREQEIIKSLFGIDTRALTIDEAGRKFGLTQQRIGQIRDTAIRMLQDRVGA
jgi:RNA polymerase primary sigma factor